MTDPERTDDRQTPASNDTPREHVEPTPCWRRPAFTVLAALIALIAMVWRCA